MRRIIDAVDRYAETRQGDVQKLKGLDAQWRLRVGDWRVIFTHMEDGIHVLEVANRRDAYR